MRRSSRVFSWLFALALGVALTPTPARARPEYALKQAMSCTQCHVNPWGGGPRLVYGKVFGTRNLGTTKLTQIDTVSGSLRVTGFYPRKPTQSTSGVALMEASASGNAAIIERTATTGELRGVLTYNAAPLNPGVREAYARYATPGEGVPWYAMVGRFNVPFGLFTDEHRTYTRQQTNMTLNNFSTGAAVSGAIVPGLNVDVALVNDFQSGGIFSSKDLTWAAVGNVRWLPPNIPILLGASQNYERTLIAPTPFGTSLYGGLSLDRLTKNRVPAQLLAEHVFALNWNQPALNPSIGTFFVPSSDATYQNSITAAHSSGYYAWVRYDVLERLSLIYKLDLLDLDNAQGGDTFTRLGVGFDYWMNGNTILTARVERAFAGRPEIANTTTLAAQDDLILMLRVWL